MLLHSVVQLKSNCKSNRKPLTATIKLQWLEFVQLPMVVHSVTRLGDFYTLGNFLKPLATINYPKSLTFLGNFCKYVKIYHFSWKSFLGNFIGIWRFFSGHTCGAAFKCHGLNSSLVKLIYHRKVNF